jgi:hypothetical protein
VAWRRQHTTTGTANNTSPSEAALTLFLRPHAAGAAAAAGHERGRDSPQSTSSQQQAR